MKLFVTDAINTLFIGVRRDRKMRETLKGYDPNLKYNAFRRIVKSEIRKVDEEIASKSELQLEDFWIGVTSKALLKAGFEGDPTQCAKHVSEISWGMPELYELADGSRSFLEYVKKKGIKTAVLSNQDSRLKRFIKHFNLNEYFDDVYISALRGVEKPNPLFYRMPLDDFGIEGKDTMYLDDSKKAVLGAVDIYGLCLLYNPQEPKEFNKSINNWNQLYEYV